MIFFMLYEGRSIAGISLIYILTIEFVLNILKLGCYYHSHTGHFHKVSYFFHNIKLLVIIFCVCVINFFSFFFKSNVLGMLLHFYLFLFHHVKHLSFPWTFHHSPHPPSTSIYISPFYCSLLPL